MCVCVCVCACGDLETRHLGVLVETLLDSGLHLSRHLLHELVIRGPQRRLLSELLVRLDDHGDEDVEHHDVREDGVGHDEELHDHGRVGEELLHTAELTQGHSEEHLNRLDEAAKDVVVAECNGAQHGIGDDDEEIEDADRGDVDEGSLEHRAELCEPLAETEDHDELEDGQGGDESEEIDEELVVEDGPLKREEVDDAALDLRHQVLGDDVAQDVHCDHGHSSDEQQHVQVRPNLTPEVAGTHGCRQEHEHPGVRQQQNHERNLNHFDVDGVEPRSIEPDDGIRDVSFSKTSQREFDPHRDKLEHVCVGVEEDELKECGACASVEPEQFLQLLHGPVGAVDVDGELRPIPVAPVRPERARAREVRLLPSGLVHPGRLRLVPAMHISQFQLPHHLPPVLWSKAKDRNVVFELSETL